MRLDVKNYFTVLEIILKNISITIFFSFIFVRICLRVIIIKIVLRIVILIMFLNIIIAGCKFIIMIFFLIVFTRKVSFMVV